MTVTPLEAPLALISSSQIQDLVTNPVVLVPAPGAGKLILPTLALLEFTPGTQQMVNGGSVFISLNGTTVSDNMNSSLIQGAVVATTTIGGLTYPLSPPVNGPLVLAATGGVDFSGNTSLDATLQVKLYYLLINL